MNVEVQKRHWKVLTNCFVSTLRETKKKLFAEILWYMMKGNGISSFTDYKK